MARPDDVPAVPRVLEPVPRSAWSVLALVFIATVIMSLSGTMLNIALPQVVDDLDASPVQTSWILLSYMLVNTSLLVVMGQVADSVDRRRMFLAGLALFTLTGLGLGLAASVEAFLVLRGLQGLAAAVLLCNAVAIITAVFPRRLLNRAMGVYLSGFSIAQVAGPSVGGLITTFHGWRWLFWATIPLGVVALVWGWRTLRHVPPRVHRRGGVDVLGNGIILMGLASLLAGVSAASGRSWDDPLVIGGIAVFVLLLPAFVMVERRADRPAIDLLLFRSRPFSRAMAAGFLLTMPRLSVVVVAVLYFQGVHGDSPLQAAFKVTPLAAGLTLGALVADGLTRWVDERRLVVASAGVCIGGMLGLIRTVGDSGDVAPMLVWLTVVGLGNGVLHPLNSSMVMRRAPMARAGSVNAVRVMAQSSGMTVSTALALTVVVSGVSAATARRFFSGGADALSPAEVALLGEGYQAGFGVLTGMLVLGLVVAVLDARAPLPGGQPPARTAAQSPEAVLTTPGAP